MKYLGIDYGMKRIGLAVSDENGFLAFPKEIIKNNGESMRKIINLIEKEKIAEIVIGESFDFDGMPNAILKQIEFFQIELERKNKLPVYRQKEFLTTIEARRYQNGSVDDSAAALILQRYLDKLNKYKTR